jgi:hypothetical protein
MAGDDGAATCYAAAAPRKGWRTALETFAAAGTNGEASLKIDEVLDSAERAVLHAAWAYTRPLLSST